MNQRPRLKLTEIVLDAPDAHALAEFYQRLLGGTFGTVESDWVTLHAPGVEPTLAFGTERPYAVPGWPERDGQQMMAHLDFLVDDLEEAVAFAVSVGAVVAEHQPQRHVRVLLDPGGHPFCLWVEPDEA